MFRFVVNIFFVFTRTANFFEAEMSVAEIRRELKILPVVTSFVYLLDYLFFFTSVPKFLYKNVFFNK